MIDIEKLINTIYQKFPCCKCGWKKIEQNVDYDSLDYLKLRIRCYVCGLEYTFSTVYNYRYLNITRFSYDFEADEIIRKIKSEIEIISKTHAQKMEMEKELDFKGEGDNDEEKK